jgi:hypothetical protein
VTFLKKKVPVQLSLIVSHNLKRNSLSFKLLLKGTEGTDPFSETDESLCMWRTLIWNGTSKLYE